MTRRARAVRLIAVATVATAACSCSSSPLANDGPAGEVSKFTGTPTKVVWVQNDGRDPAATDNLVLMGFSTEDGKGERVILGRQQSYVKPLLTARGERILFSTRPHGDGPEVFVVNWDGSGLRKLAKGFALTSWQHPLDNREWVYVGTGNTGYDFATVSRFPIDDPSRVELVWNQTLVSSDTFQVSADGRMAAGLFPWPNAGIAELPNRAWKKLGDGCWTAMADARGALFWYFDGSHRNLTLVDARTDKRWGVPINQAPGFQNAEVYHPRWTNHPRFLAISGPYNQGGANQVRAGGAQTEIWLGRFSEDFTRVEAWARVTNNSGGDAFPDVWMDRDRSPYPVRPSGPVGPAVTAGAPAGTAASPRPSVARLVIEARLSHAGPIPTPASIAPYRHALVVSEYDVVGVVNGEYGAKKIQVARWAIRDGRVLANARQVAGTAVRMTLERFDAHPELEGERLITDLAAAELPLFYEIKS